MNQRLAHLLTRLYPRPWRERYGEEFESLLRDSHGDLRTSANVLLAACGERLLPTQAREAHRPAHSFGAIVRRPSAFLPMAMSLVALAAVLAKIAISGTAPEADEGAATHTWQLLMGGQLPVLAFFLLRWLPRAPRQALFVLALQAGAVLAALAPVFLLRL